MTVPKQTEMEIPLLEEIEKAGGTATPKELYSRITVRFPQVTEEDLRDVKLDGTPKWPNRIAFVRLRLVHKGELDGSVRGVWAITEAGRGRLKNHREGRPYTPTATMRTRKKVAITATQERVDHDEVARALEKIGQAFGFDTVWKPKVNALRPDKRAFQAKRKTLDVAWKIANLAWVPIEVQVAGSVADLIYRFQQVHQWSLRLVVVTVPAFRDEILEAIHDYPFRDKVILLHPKEVLAATRSLDSLLELKAAIFES